MLLVQLQELAPVFLALGQLLDESLQNQNHFFGASTGVFGIRFLESCLGHVLAILIRVAISLSYFVRGLHFLDLRLIQRLIVLAHRFNTFLY
jgi:hypothetical protein